MSASQDLLSFSCPNCGVQLRVPASMAGIEGPCPSCAAIIQAPSAPHHSPSSTGPDSQTSSAPLSPATTASDYAGPPRSHTESEKAGPPRDEVPSPPPGDKSSPREQIPSSTSDPSSSSSIPPQSSSHPTAQSYPHSRRAAPAPQAHAPAGKEPSSDNAARLEDRPEQRPPLKPSPVSTNPEDTTISANSAKNNSSTNKDPELDPLLALKPTAVKDLGHKERDRLPTSSLPSERKSRTHKQPDLPTPSEKLSPPEEDLPDLDSSESMAPVDSPSVECSSATERPDEPTSRKSRLFRSDRESEETVKLNVNASTVGALVSHEHAGRLENSRRSHPTWPGISVLLLFLTLSAVMIYLVLDLTDMLPHSKRQGQLQDPPAGEALKPPPAAGEASAPAAAAGAPNHKQEPSASERTAGVFKVDPNQLFPGSSQTGQSVQPNPETFLGTEEKDLSSEDLLGRNEDSEEGALLVPAGGGEAAPGGAIIEEQDVKVTGEVSLPPLIDLNPSRNALPEQSGIPSAPAETLSLFLAARNLSERRPYMSASRRSEAELERGPLAKQLPPTVKLRLLKYVKDHSEKTDERFFEVSFERESTAPILVQVAVNSNGRMQVHTDAFLDLYNDEMARFQAVPVKGERTFHTLADAYKQCFEEKIPGAEDKSYIKLRQHEQVTARLQAYFAKESKISAQIEQSKALPWGRSGICTVTVRWNTDYGRPYVELVSIDELSWAP